MVLSAKAFDLSLPLARVYWRNAWNYTLYVPCDPADLIKMMGGDQAISLLT